MVRAMLRRISLVLAAALFAAPLACTPTEDAPAHVPGAGGAGGTAGNGTGGTGEPAPPVPTIELESLVIQPGGGRAFLLDALANATESVRVVAYILTDDQVEDAIVAAAARGIDVRAIVPSGLSTNAQARTKLTNAGIPVRDGNPAFALTHQKALVVDGDLAFVLNQNLSWSGFETNREYNAVITGKPAQDVAAIFDADWNQQGYAGATDLVVSPTNSRTRLETLLLSANERIDLAMEVVNDERMIDLLARQAQDGIEVRVLLEDPAEIRDHADTAAELEAAGVEVRWLPSPDLHAKAMVIDGRFAYIGSVNFTWSSLGRNREVGLVTADTEAVARILATFETDFANGVAF